MTIGVDDLLLGPRGRRLLLELALRCEGSDDLWRALHATVSTTGTAYRRTGLARRRDHEDTSDGAPRTASTPQGFADLLARTALRRPTTDDLWHALAESVEHARYWEAPDAEDDLAAHPAMGPALAAVAEQALPHLPPWWSLPVGPDEDPQVVAFETGQHPEDSAPTPSIAQALREGRRDAVEHSGTWWSAPPTSLPRTSRTTPDGMVPGLALVEDGHGWTRALCSRARVDPAARVLEIDDPAVWTDLCRSSPLDVREAREGLWSAATGTSAHWVQPDWEAVAREFDGIHVSVRGYLTSAGRALDVGDGRASVMAGIDPDETIWFRPVEVDRERSEIWSVTPGETALWHRV